MQAKNISGAFYVMDDDWLLVLLGKKDVTFEKLQLKVVGLNMETVKACFADGGYLVFFKKVFKDGQIG